MGDDFYRSKDPTNSIKVLKEHSSGHIYYMSSVTVKPISILTNS